MDRIREDFPDCPVQSGELRGLKICSDTCRMEARAKQALIGVDIAYSAQNTLIE